MTSSRRVLMIEDMDTVSGPVSRELQSQYGYDVTCLRDPSELTAILPLVTFDVAVVDLLFEPMSRGFQARLAAGDVNLGSGPLLITGLTALRLLAQARHPIPSVVWTTAEANRRLHLIYAREEAELGTKCFCSKTPGTGTTETLHLAIEAACAGQAFADPAINPYLPSPTSPRLSDTLLKDACSRSIWRAIAAGAKDRATISRLTPYKMKTVANQIGRMYECLREFDQGLPETRFAQNEIVSYAGRNWEFFLDDAVRLLSNQRE